MRAEDAASPGAKGKTAYLEVELPFSVPGNDVDVGVAAVGVFGRERIRIDDYSFNGTGRRQCVGGQAVHINSFGSWLRSCQLFCIVHPIVGISRNTPEFGGIERNRSKRWSRGRVPGYGDGLPDRSKPQLQHKHQASPHRVFQSGEAWR